MWMALLLMLMRRLLVACMLLLMCTLLLMFVVYVLCPLDVGVYVVVCAVVVVDDTVENVARDVDGDVCFVVGIVVDGVCFFDM